MKTKNYMTPYGFSLLQNELKYLLKEKRPSVVDIVSWAAKNGDRSENGDYIYGKKQLREMDRRIRYLTKKLNHTEIVDPKRQQSLSQVFFGATVTYCHLNDNKPVTVKLVGIDESNAEQGKISSTSPLAQALLKASVGDIVRFKTPNSTETVKVLAIIYQIEK